VNHSESTSSVANLFSGNRGGERYGAVLGGGQAPGQILPGAGKDLTAYQLDATWDMPNLPLKFYGNYGLTKDRDTNGPSAGTPEERWRYFAADAKWNLAPSLYAAVRYSGAGADKLKGLSSDGRVNRIQIGRG